MFVEKCICQQIYQTMQGAVVVLHHSHTAVQKCEIESEPKLFLYCVFV